ncbi:MAG: DVUA0089 family protein, partial [Acidobacteriaceae bacterium]|nr:DVUA0089 family protein [Acidobacteriaceae bacterium]
GGFDTILTLFSASGGLLTENDDGTGVATDPTAGLARDARITANLAAGSYLLALTQYDNFARGNLADGFVEAGHPNFTAAPSFATGGACPGNLFRDISGTAGRCRNGNWTVDFTNVASVTAVPEPSALLLAGLGLAFLLVSRCRRRKTVTLLAGGLVAGSSLFAQSGQNPDFTNVNDILHGNRTLFQVTDLEIASTNSLNSVDLYQLPMSNSSRGKPR